MAYTSEIEKLERRYAENPKGRNFAPLADAYRKAGQLDQAIELCKSGIERHPDYVSAHIVFGRCLIDMKDDPGAEAVFRKVLSLDPENVIAFKVLADVSDRGARYDETVQWLTRLLTADPMNGDAAEALAVAKRRAAERAPAPVLAPPPPASPVVARTDPEVPAVQKRGAAAPAADLEPAAIDPGALVLEHASVVTRLADPTPPPPSSASPVAPTDAPPGLADLETFDGTMRVEPGVTAGTEGIELQEEVKLTPANLVIEGLARTQYEGSGVFKVDGSGAAESLAAPDGAAQAPDPVQADGNSTRASGAQVVPVADEALEDLPVVDLPLIMPDDVVRPSRRARPTPPPPAAPPPPPAPRPQARWAVESGAQATALDDDGAADTAALSRVEPVLTETMAELYLRQGHTDDAVRVYEALLTQRPGDQRLKDKLDALTGRGAAASGQTVRAFLHALFAGQGGTLVATVPVAAPAAAETSLAGAFAATPRDGEMPGAASYASDDALSLDQVFGDDARPSQTLAPPPAPRMAGPPAPATAPAGRTAATPAAQRAGGFSFDEFFDSNAAPDARPAAPGSASTSGPTRAPVRVKAAAEDESDLDQFQAWLKGLKT